MTKHQTLLIWRASTSITDSSTHPGRLYNWDGTDLYIQYAGDYGPSRHLTVVFNVFVLMQVFNLINARKIHDEINVFAGFFDNSMFLIVFFIIFILQIVLTQWTQDVMKVARDGLNLIQWAICLGLGLSVFIIDFFLKFIPDTICPQVSTVNPDSLVWQETAKSS